VQSDKIFKISFIFSQYEINIDGDNNENKIVLLSTFWHAYFHLIGDFTC
jgi:hypothetical protein